MKRTSDPSPTRARACLCTAALASLAACGFSPQPQSGTMVCKAQGSACCPEGDVCVGRGLATPGGPADGTCWSKADLPVEAFTAVHDYTPAVPSDPACLVTDWLPPELVALGNLPDASVSQPDVAPSTDAGKDTGALVSFQLAAPGTISLGFLTSFFVSQGALLAWGDNSLGFLGDGTTTDRLRPVVVPGLPPGVSAVSAGESHSCAVVNGGVYCWGRNDYWQLGVDSVQYSSKVPVMAIEMGSGATAVAVGFHHTCALVSGGVQCWGEGTYGQLGDGSTLSSKALPQRVPDLAVSVTALAAGELHACAVVRGGVRCWGSNGYGQLGDGTQSRRTSPTAVVGLESGVTAVSAYARGKHTCALARGTAYCWGYNYAGTLGDGTFVDSYVPVQVKGLSSAVMDIACGDAATCAILATGAAACWGSNNCYLQGGGTSDWRSAIPIPITALKSAAERIATSGCHACVVVGAGGGVKCWGANMYGQLGNGDTKDSKVPVDVKLQ